MSYETLLLEKYNDICILVLNLPICLNAIYMQMIDEPEDVLKKMDADMVILRTIWDPFKGDREKGRRLN